MHASSHASIWIITDGFAVPWCDVRFRGYHRNKIAHVASLNASGFGFVAHPTAFLMHRPHEPRKARLVCEVE